ncbi:class I SAM-dependent methyltransferase [Mucilaginibacter sp.]|uniref:class I SAM-dependent methyltransferase n=1 Tax=Mucilaginibacter sp. TaxID=1882438 RepID=UPI0026349A97|nr:class I SAM-dependent methyltransferase [Mucilaginibacter sp.]MDB5030996.1 putative methyltransferase [Mucilaginibacter sp.]
MKAYPFSYFPPVPDNYNRSLPIKQKRDHLNDALFSNDAAFDWLYPENFQLLSLKHWTPLAIACKAAEFLAEPGARVLDIGSGIGKFCLAAGHHFPETFFYGVEQRHELIYLAEQAKGYTKLSNVNFIYANITQINFKEFDHFYFYNSFYENIDPENQIDDTIELSESLYTYYNQYLCAALDEKPSGTRLVTFHSFEKEIPPGFKLADISCNGLMKMWIKT